jgi:hypothetical protein
VLDFQCNIFKPTSNCQVFERLGPNASLFPAQLRSQISTEMSDIINNDNDANRQLVEKYVKYNKYKYCCLAMVPLSMGGMAAASVLSGYATLLGLGVLAGFVALVCWLYSTLKSIAIQWRLQILAQLEPKLEQWNARCPAFTFTIIYPVKVWRSAGSGGGRRGGGRRGGRRRGGRRKLAAIWIYVRVTQGLCQTGLCFGFCSSCVFFCVQKGRT